MEICIVKSRRPTHATVMQHQHISPLGIRGPRQDVLIYDGGELSWSWYLNYDCVHLSVKDIKKPQWYEHSRSP